MTHLRFDQLTRTDLAEIAPRATVVVPLGSIEQHGPHLPVCVDTAIVSTLAERAATLASEHIPVVLAPTLPFGFADHHLAFGGTISIGLSTYLEVLTSIGRSLVLDGFRRILFLNGHGGNDAPVREVGDRLVFELKLPAHVAGTSYWSCAADALAELNLDIGPMPGHAGGFETSCLLAIAPELVRTDLMPSPESDLQPLARVQMPGAVIRRPGAWEISDGRTDDSGRASAEIGHRVLDALSQRISRFIVDFHHAADALPAPSRIDADGEVHTSVSTVHAPADGASASNGQAGSHAFSPTDQ